ncbi:MAG TPA: 50S ribosomal protein L29 [Candidatus Nanoarchaeia archaeon]|nr:50S ribosomal protein L29 [Candidatus Nanoarchaeia archaeon]
MKAAKELRNLSAGELSTRLLESKKELFKLHSSSTGAATGKIKKNKKNIARILTILHEKGRLQK